MEKKNKQLKKSFVLVKLYKNDLEEINNILINRFDKIIWETEEYKYYKFDDFINNELLNTKSLKSLYINIPTFGYINFDKSNSEIIFYNDDIETAGIFLKLSDLISNCESLPFISRFIKNNSTLILISFLLISLFINNNKLILRNNEITVWYYRSKISLFIIFLFFAGYINLRNSIIYLNDRKNKSNFFIRNKDSLITNLIFLILGGLITIFINMFLSGQ